MNIYFTVVAILIFTRCMVSKPDYKYDDIISADSISVKLTKGNVIEENKKDQIVLLQLTICNKTNRGFYIHSGGLNRNVKSITGENIYFRFDERKRYWLFSKYLDSLPRANKALDSITLKRINNEVSNSVSKVHDKEVQNYFKVLFEDMFWCLCFIEPKTTYVVTVPVLRYKNKKSDKVYFFYHDFFDIIESDDKAKIYKENFDKYIKLPEVLGDYYKLNGTLISDTLELK